MDPTELRAAVPAFESGIYLNTGATGPSPRAVTDAAAAAHQYHEHEAPVAEGAYQYAFDLYEETRETLASFLGAKASEIALTHSTADGIARIAASIDWEPGDIVVRTDLAHSAGVLPWRNAPCDVRVIETDGGRLDTDCLAEQLEDARLISLSSITWTYGTRLPIEEVVEIAHETDTLVLVDAVQSPGQTAVDLGDWNADFVVGAGHKWLLGPWGSGFLYISESSQLTPAQVGYRSVEEESGPESELKPGAARFEIGTRNVAPCAGVQAAVETIESIGIETIESEIDRLTARLKDGLGKRCLSPASYESGLVSFTVEDPESVVERLADQDIYIRALPFPERVVRASVHVYNTADDVDALLDALGTVRAL